MLYHDKHFQTDYHFPLVAFNHLQIRQSTTGGHLLTKKNMFSSIADRLSKLDTDVLLSLIERTKKGHVKPVTEDEKICYQVIQDLDHIASHVNGSLLLYSER